MVCRSPDPVSGPGGRPGAAGSGDGGVEGRWGDRGEEGGAGGERERRRRRGEAAQGEGEAEEWKAHSRRVTHSSAVGAEAALLPFTGRSLGSSSPERKIRWVEPGWKENSWQRSPATGCHPSRLHSNATSLKPSGIHPWLPGSRGAPGEPGFILLLIDLGWRELGVTCRLLFSGPYGG